MTLGKEAGGEARGTGRGNQELKIKTQMYYPVIPAVQMSFIRTGLHNVLDGNSAIPAVRMSFIRTYPMPFRCKPSIEAFGFFMDI